MFLKTIKYIAFILCISLVSLGNVNAQAVISSHIADLEKVVLTGTSTDAVEVRVYAYNLTTGLEGDLIATETVVNNGWSIEVLLGTNYDPKIDQYYGVKGIDINNVESDLSTSYLVSQVEYQVVNTALSGAGSFFEAMTTVQGKTNVIIDFNISGTDLIEIPTAPSFNGSNGITINGLNQATGNRIHLKIGGAVFDFDASSSIDIHDFIIESISTTAISLSNSNTINLSNLEIFGENYIDANLIVIDNCNSVDMKTSYFYKAQTLLSLENETSNILIDDCVFGDESNIDPLLYSEFSISTNTSSQPLIPRNIQIKNNRFYNTKKRHIALGHVIKSIIEGNIIDGVYNVSGGQPFTSFGGISISGNLVVAEEDVTLISGNTIRNFVGAGIYLSGTGPYMPNEKHFLIEDNTIENGEYGINLFQIRSSDILNNTVTGMSKEAFYGVTLGDVDIIENIFESTLPTAVRFSNIYSLSPFSKNRIIGAIDKSNSSNNQEIAPITEVIPNEDNTLTIKGTGDHGEKIEVFYNGQVSSPLNALKYVETAEPILVSGNTWEVTIPKGEFYDPTRDSYYVTTATDQGDNTSELSLPKSIKPKECVVKNTNRTGEGSFTEALACANGKVEQAIIDFAIPSNLANVDNEFVIEGGNWEFTNPEGITLDGTDPESEIEEIEYEIVFDGSNLSNEPHQKSIQIETENNVLNNLTIRNYSMQNFHEAIVFSKGNNEFKNLNVINCYRGISKSSLDYLSNLKIHNSFFSNCNEPIKIYRLSDVEFTNNSFESNLAFSIICNSSNTIDFNNNNYGENSNSIGTGPWLINCDDVIFINDTIWDAKGSSIVIQQSENVELIECAILADNPLDDNSIISESDNIRFTKTTFDKANENRALINLRLATDQESNLGYQSPSNIEYYDKINGKVYIIGEADYPNAKIEVFMNADGSNNAPIYLGETTTSLTQKTNDKYDWELFELPETVDLNQPIFILSTVTDEERTSQFSETTLIEIPCPTVVTNTNDNVEGSFRAAVACANGTPNTLSDIVFDIVGDGEHEIVLTGSVNITSPVNIKGETEDGIITITAPGVSSDAISINYNIDLPTTINQINMERIGDVSHVALSVSVDVGDVTLNDMHIKGVAIPLNISNAGTITITNSSFVGSSIGNRIVSINNAESLNFTDNVVSNGWSGMFISGINGEVMIQNNDFLGIQQTALNLQRGTIKNNHFGITEEGDLQPLGGAQAISVSKVDEDPLTSEVVSIIENTFYLNSQIGVYTQNGFTTTNLSENIFINESDNFENEENKSIHIGETAPYVFSTVTEVVKGTNQITLKGNASEAITRPGDVIELFYNGTNSRKQNALTYVPTTPIIVDNNGDWSVTINTGNYYNPNDYNYYTTTATDMTGNTAELSSPFLVDAPCTTLVTNTNDNGEGSLRAAITCANGTGEDIHVDIPGIGDNVIQLETQLEFLKGTSCDQQIHLYGLDQEGDPLILSGDNTFDGLRVINASINNVTAQNMNNGFSLRGGSQLIDSKAIDNVTGVFVGRNDLVQNCIIANNSFAGIGSNASSGFTIRDNHIYNNSGSGINLFRVKNVNVLNNHVGYDENDQQSENGTAINLAESVDHTTIKGNSIFSGESFSIVLSPGLFVENNVISENIIENNGVEKGIDLGNGTNNANNGQEEVLITGHQINNDGSVTLTGSGDAGELIELFYNGSNQTGENALSHIALGPITVNANGDWQITIPGGDFYEAIFDNYYVTTATELPVFGPEKTINGDFTQNICFDETVFTSTLSSGCGTTSPSSGKYFLTENPSSLTGAWKVYEDHTTGDGGFMLVGDGATDDRIIWKQFITVELAKTYNLSLFARSIFLSNPPELSIKINGECVGSVSTVFGWEESNFDWTANTSGEIAIEIIQKGNSGTGNDLGLDDISFKEYVSFGNTSELSDPYLVPTDICWVTTTANEGEGSLREAIICANANADLSSISFNIPETMAEPDGTYILNITSALPVITEAVLIDGFTQTGDETRTIILRGAETGNIPTINGLVFTGMWNSTVRGLILEGFITGIDASNNEVKGNFRIQKNIIRDIKEDGFYFRAVRGGIEVTDNEFINIGKIAARFRDAKDKLVIESNVLKNIGTEGISIFLSNVPSTSRINDNHITDVEDIGISIVRRGYYGEINNNVLIVSEGSNKDMRLGAIRVFDAHGGKITNNTIDNAKFGIHFNDGNATEVSNNKISNSSTHGIYAINGLASSYPFNNVTFQGNKITNSVSRGIYVHRGNNITFSSDTIQDCNYHGLSLKEVTGAVITNGKYVNNGSGIATSQDGTLYGSGIFTDHSDNIRIGSLDTVINKNDISSNTHYGIQMNFQNNEALENGYMSILNNDIKNNGLSGIHVSDVHPVLMQENEIENNEEHGVYSNQTISEVSHNFIQGNTENGIFFDNTEGTIQGNEIGTLQAGNKNGIAVTSSTVTIGGTTQDKNIILNNSENGVYLDGQSDVTITNNLIGVDAMFTNGISYGNKQHGIASYLMDGILKVENNTIGNNGSNGIYLGENGVLTVYSNFIGTDETGTNDLGNQSVGVEIQGSEDKIGEPNRLNKIAFNKSDGILIHGEATVQANQNIISGNEIYSNTGKAINLDDEDNDPNDSPGNNAIPAPKIVDGFIRNGIIILEIEAETGSKVEVFTNKGNYAQNALMYVDGKNADENGKWFVTINPTTAPDKVTDFYVATATNSSGTSELSSPFDATNLPCVCLVTNTLSDGPNSLRDAIECANGVTTSRVEIRFEMDTELQSTYTIFPETELPAITTPLGVTIDATSQDGIGEGEYITIDGTYGSTNVSTGIVFESGVDHTFKNFNVQEFVQGIVMKTNKTTIGENLIIDNVSEGIVIDGANNTLVENNVVGSNTTGIEVKGGLNNKITNNRIGFDQIGTQNIDLGNNKGIDITQVDQKGTPEDKLEIFNNTFGYNRYGIEQSLNSSSLTISGLQKTHIYENRIGITLGGIPMINFGSSGTGIGTGIYITNSQNVEVNNNKTAYQEKGIQLNKTVDTDVHHNDVGYVDEIPVENQIGIDVSGDNTNLEIFLNQIGHNRRGIFASGTGLSLVDNCVFSSKLYGIDLTNLTADEITGNYAWGSVKYDLVCTNLKNTLIENNKFGIEKETGNVAYGPYRGVYLNKTTTDNLVLRNNEVAGHKSQGIYMINVANVTMEDNNVYDNGAPGYDIIESSDITIIKDTVRGNKEGIRINKSKRIFIDQSDVTGNRNSNVPGIAVVVLKSDSVKVSKTTMTDHRHEQPINLFKESSNESNQNPPEPIVERITYTDTEVKVTINTSRDNSEVELFRSNFGIWPQIKEYISPISIEINGTEWIGTFEKSVLLKSDLEENYFVATSTKDYRTSEFSETFNICPTCECLVTNTSDEDKNGSFRNAINKSNKASCGTINFEITPGDDAPNEILVNSQLPSIWNAITIDGTTEAVHFSSAVSPLIQLKGNASITNGLDLLGEGIIVKNLLIDGFDIGVTMFRNNNVLTQSTIIGSSGTHVNIHGDNNTLTDNFIHTTPEGYVTGNPKPFQSIIVKGDDNKIGVPNHGNTIYGASSAGILVLSIPTSGADRNSILSNVIVSKSEDQSINYKGIKHLQTGNDNYPAPVINAGSEELPEHIKLTGTATEGALIQLFSSEIRKEQAIGLLPDVEISSAGNNGVWEAFIPKSYFPENENVFFIATATSPSGNTSEFSNTALVGGQEVNCYVRNTNDVGAESLRDAVNCSNQAGTFGLGSNILFDLEVGEDITHTVEPQSAYVFTNPVKTNIDPEDVKFIIKSSASFDQDVFQLNGVKDWSLKKLSFEGFNATISGQGDNIIITENTFDGGAHTIEMINTDLTLTDNTFKGNIKGFAVKLTDSHGSQLISNKIDQVSGDVSYPIGDAFRIISSSDLIVGDNTFGVAENSIAGSAIHIFGTGLSPEQVVNSEGKTETILHDNYFLKNTFNSGTHAIYSLNSNNNKISENIGAFSIGDLYVIDGGINNTLSKNTALPDEQNNTVVGIQLLNGGNLEKVGPRAERFTIKNGVLTIAGGGLIEGERVQIFEGTELNDVPLESRARKYLGETFAGKRKGLDLVEWEVKIPVEDLTNGLNGSYSFVATTTDQDGNTSEFGENFNIDLTACEVVNTNDANEGSLRNALYRVNELNECKLIIFEIPLELIDPIENQFVIELESPLPSPKINDLIIDGSSQEGYLEEVGPVIKLKPKTEPLAYGFKVDKYTSDGQTEEVMVDNFSMHAFEFNGFETGIVLKNATQTQITSNWINNSTSVGIDVSLTGITEPNFIDTNRIESEFNADYGIKVTGSNLIIEDNEVRGHNIAGVYFTEASSVEMFENVIENGLTESVKEVDTELDVIKEIIISSEVNGTYGIYVENSEELRIRRNGIRSSEVALYVTTIPTEDPVANPYTETSNNRFEGNFFGSRDEINNIGIKSVNADKNTYTGGVISASVTEPEVDENGLPGTPITTEEMRVGVLLDENSDENTVDRIYILDAKEVGVRIDGGEENVIQYSEILKNTVGIEITNGATNNTLDSNIVYLNEGAGVVLQPTADGNRLIRNSIGTYSGENNFKNEVGIEIYSNNNTIGGTEENGNSIAFNPVSGISILEGAILNEITYNSIHSNDLSRDKPTTGVFGINLNTSSVNRGNGVISPPFITDYIRSGEDYIIRGEGVAGEKIHLYQSNGFQQDARIYFSEGTVESTGKWEVTVSKDLLDPDKTNYLISTATNEVDGTSQFSNIIPIGNCIVTTNEDNGANDFPLPGTLRDAYKCVNGQGEQVSIIFKLNITTSVPEIILKTEHLPYLTNKGGVLYDGFNQLTSTEKARLEELLEPDEVLPEPTTTITVDGSYLLQNTSLLRLGNELGSRPRIDPENPNTIVSNLTFKGACIPVLIEARDAEVSHLELDAEQQTEENIAEELFFQTRDGVELLAVNFKNTTNENIGFNSSIKHSTIKGYETGVLVSGSLIKDVTVEGNRILNPNKGIVVSNSAADISVINNEILDSKEASIHVKNITGIIETIAADPPVDEDGNINPEISISDILIKGNVISTPSYKGIWLENTNSIDLVGNSIYNTRAAEAGTVKIPEDLLDGHAILVTGPSTGLVIKEGIISTNNGAGQISSLSMFKTVNEDVHTDFAIQDNTITGSLGLGLTGQNHLVEKNTLTSTSINGYLLTNSTILNNTIVEPVGDAIYLALSNQVELSQNIIEGTNGRDVEHLSIDINLGSLNESNLGKPAPKFVDASQSTSDDCESTFLINGTGEELAIGDKIEVFFSSEFYPDTRQYLGESFVEQEGVWSFVVRQEFFKLPSEGDYYFTATATSTDKRTSQLSDIFIVESFSEEIIVTSLTDDQFSGEGTTFREAIAAVSCTQFYATVSFEFVEEGAGPYEIQLDENKAPLVPINNPMGFSIDGTNFTELSFKNVNPEDSKITINGDYSLAIQIEEDSEPGNIKNLGFNGFTNGISVANSGNVLEALRLKDASKSGVGVKFEAETAKSNTLENSTIEGFSKGILVEANTSENEILDNEIINVGEGIVLEDNTQETLVFENYIGEVSVNGISLRNIGKDEEGNFNEVEPNLIRSNVIGTKKDGTVASVEGYGIYLDHVYKQSIDQNVILNTTSTLEAIYLESGEFNGITNNFIGLKDTGEETEDEGKIAEFTSMNSRAITLTKSSSAPEDQVRFNNVTGNTISDYSGTAITVDGGYFNTISGNDIGYGLNKVPQEAELDWNISIHIKGGSEGDILSNNYIYGSKTNGIKIDAPKNITMSENVIYSDQTTNNGIKVANLNQQDPTIIDGYDLISENELKIYGKRIAALNSGDLVELFAANGDKSQSVKYLGSTIVDNDQGTWEIYINGEDFSFGLDHFVTTTTRKGQGTTRFSEPKLVNGLLCIFFEDNPTGLLPENVAYCPGGGIELIMPLDNVYYQWKYEGEEIGNEQSVLVNKPGNYSLTIRSSVNDDDNSCEKTFNITSEELPAAAEPSFLVSTDVALNNTLVVINTMDNPDHSLVEFDFGRANATAAPNPVNIEGYDPEIYHFIKFPEQGEYDIFLNSYNPNRTCVTRIRKPITVSASGEISTGETVEVGEFNLLGISIIPNPISEEMEIPIGVNMSVKKDFTINVFNASDLKLIFQKFVKEDDAGFASGNDGITTNTVAFNWPGLYNGTYVVEVISDGEIMSERFVVNK